MASRSCPCPRRRPSRALGTRYGQFDMDSMPPATTTSVSPVAMPCAASMTAFRPEPQTLLMVRAATFGGRPAWMAAWRAGAWPTPAEITLPMMTSWTSWGDRPERATASRTTIAPSWGAVNDLRAPRNLPVGRRTAERITGSRMLDRKSTRLNSSHLGISYAVFCLKKKKNMKIKPVLNEKNKKRYKHGITAEHDKTMPDKPKIAVMSDLK